MIVTIGERTYQSKPGPSKVGPDAPAGAVAAAATPVAPARASRPKRSNAGRSGARGADFISGDFGYGEGDVYDAEMAEADGDGDADAAPPAKRRHLVIDFSVAEISAAIASAAELFTGGGGAGGEEQQVETASPVAAPVTIAAS